MQWDRKYRKSYWLRNNKLSLAGRFYFRYTLRPRILRLFIVAKFARKFSVWRAGLFDFNKCWGHLTTHRVQAQVLVLLLTVWQFFQIFSVEFRWNINFLNLANNNLMNVTKTYSRKLSPTSCSLKKWQVNLKIYTSN